MVIGTMTECVVEEQNGSFQNQSIGRLKRRASVAARSLWRRFVQRNLPEEIPMLHAAAKRSIMRVRQTNKRRTTASLAEDGAAIRSCNL